MRRALSAAALTLLVFGCERDAPTPAPRAEDHAEDHAEGDAPRPARGGGARDCADGSDDPEQIVLYMESAEGGNLAGAIAGLEALAGAHPGSATARVRLGELLLRDRAPARARPFFARALALHDEGCTLAPRDEWAAAEGVALTEMMTGDYADAVPRLRASLARWPGATPTRYNLACALCQTGDLDGCERELRTVLRPEAALPAFLVDQRRPADHYPRMLASDPDLAPLRADEARLARVLAAPQ